VRADGYRDAVTAALRLARPGDVVLVLYEKLAPVLAFLAELGALPGAPVLAPALPVTPAAGVVASPARDLLRAGSESVPG
jgi:cyanophycin synthetase